MKRLLFIAALVGAALWLGVAPAGAWSLPHGDDESESEVAKRKKHRDGGGDEEKEEDVRRAPPRSAY